MFRERSKLVVIVGPTASGKSHLAIVLARKYNGEIISADSRQVYRGMDIGTDKVSKREQRLVKHHLLDIASPKKIYTVHHFQRDARKAIRSIQQRGKLPILCGGTGFWIEAVLSDMTLPQVAPNKRWRTKLACLTTPQLYAKLKKLDPTRARTIDRHNPVRLIRALEIIMTTKKPVPPLKTATNYTPLIFGIRLPAHTLRARIDSRLKKRLAHGIIAEVKQLIKAGVPPKRLIELGLEYRSITQYLNGSISKKELKQQLMQAIHNYAKRQMTWFRRMQRHYPIYWVDNQKSAEALTEKFLA